MTFRKVNVASCLTAAPMFSGLKLGELERLVEASQLRRLLRGDDVFRAGQACDGLYVVLDGHIKLYAQGPAGQEKVLEVVGKGQTLADTPLFTQSAHIHHARALSDATVLLVPREVLMAELASNSAMAMRMLADVSNRVHRLMRDIEASSLQTGVRRVIDYLLRQRARAEAPAGAGQGDTGLADAAAELTVALPVSKATVASLLSVTPEYFSRILHELQARGLIAVRQRHIRIVDPEALAQYA